MAKRSRAAGRKVRVPEGYMAFLPDPLPPNLEWTAPMRCLLTDATAAVARLDGTGRALANPHLLIRLFLRREAVLSSRIEGTQATLGELLASEAGAAVNRSPADLREVANYVVALEYGLKRIDDLPLSLRFFRELHARLMAGVRGQERTPGEFRRSQNWIGRPGATLSDATYVPPPVHEMKEALGAWEKYLHDRSEPTLVQAALIHYQFEAIHPFLDGNGRVGRLAITLFLHERELLTSPLLYLSAWFEATRDEYYARLRGVTERSEWAEWLTYFLAGVAHQAVDANTRAARILDTLSQWRKIAAGTRSRAAVELVDLLEGNPFCTAKGVAEKLNIAFTTAERAIKALIEADILEPMGESRRNRVFRATALQEILEAPTRIRGARRR